MIVRVDVPAVFVTVVLVATIVMGAGVIVVVLSTVARKTCQFFALNVMRLDKKLTVCCLSHRGSGEARRHRDPMGSVGVC